MSLLGSGWLHVDHHASRGIATLSSLACDEILSHCADIDRIPIESTVSNQTVPLCDPIDYDPLFEDDIAPMASVPDACEQDWCCHRRVGAMRCPCQVCLWACDGAHTHIF